MEHEEILNAIISYVAHSQLWHKLRLDHTDEQLNNLMLKIIGLEDTLLAHYGLPATRHFSELFQFLALSDDFAIQDAEDLVSELELAATAYLTGPVMTDAELLTIARKEGLCIDEVLPATSLKLKAEPYYDYLYETKLMSGIIEPEGFMDEVRKVSGNKLGPMLNKLAIAPEINNIALGELEKYHLDYAMDFIRNYRDFKLNN